MRRVTLRRSGLTVSRLGFGTSRLHHVSGNDAKALISAALDAGITHFDTARLYGDGFAEEILGAVLPQNRRDVTVGTKFGLLPSGLIGRAGRFATALQGARSVLRRAGVLGGPRRSWTAGTLERSVSDSLKALRTERIDALFLHEPRIEELSRADELVEALRRLKESGRIAAVGISSDPPVAGWLLERFAGQIEVVQTPEAEWREDSLIPDITFGAISRGPQVFGAAKQSADTVRERFRLALARRPDGCLLVGTTNPVHLRELAHIAAGETA